MTKYFDAVHTPVRAEQGREQDAADARQAIAARSGLEKKRDPLAHYRALAREAEAHRAAGYVAALKAHDWDYDTAADMALVQVGFRQRARLMLEAAEVDPRFELWNCHCPAMHKRKPV